MKAAMVTPGLWRAIQLQDARRKTAAERSSAGQISYVGIGDFLRDRANRPEHRARSI
jgi:hypothetical protein